MARKPSEPSVQKRRGRKPAPLPVGMGMAQDLPAPDEPDMGLGGLLDLSPQMNNAIEIPPG